MENRAFTLIELMIVVAIIAIIASIGIPSLLGARANANESSAIANLKNIVSAQAQLRSLGSIDQDLDGLGEYGWLSELAAVTGLRDDTGAASAVILDPPTLSATFGRVDANGVATRAGYVYRMFLGDPAGGLIPEAAFGGTPGGEGPDICEHAWICYAWPLRVGGSGSKAFAVNHSGDIIRTTNDVPTQLYDGVNKIPAGDAALSAAGILQPLSINNAPAPAQDGGVWTLVN